MADNNPTALAPMQAPTLAEMSQDFAGLVALRDMMRDGVDYGTIPGCGKKKTLLKPGAEKVLKRFLIHVVDIQVEDLSTADCIRYRVRCIGQTPDGITRGVGIGECSSDEEKYRWQRCYNDAEWEDTPDERRRMKHYDDNSVRQVRTHPADKANTILKLGKKRAMVDLALTATAASEFFTQDLDEMSPEMREQVAVERRAQPADPFTPPVVETTAETVTDDAPPRMTAERQVWERAKELGLTGDDVKAVIGEQGMPADKKRWSVADVEQICNALQALADERGGHADYDDGEPPPMEPR